MPTFRNATILAMRKNVNPEFGELAVSMRKSHVSSDDPVPSRPFSQNKDRGGPVAAVFVARFSCPLSRL
jgi:hypothetical protein